MSLPFDPPPPLTPPDLGPMGLLRILRRGLPLAVLLAVAFPILLILRLPEWAICGRRRPVTPFITQGVCIAGLWLMGLTLLRQGAPMRGRGAMVANHVSWLDIFALNADSRVYFIAKSEVALWPVIGWLARGTGTLFIERRRTAARGQPDQLRDRLMAGQHLVFFPEGTSTDGLRVLPFKTTLFEAFFTESFNSDLKIQPVTLIYRAPQAQPLHFYGWWGGMDFAEGLLRVLSAKENGQIEIVYHPALQLADFAGRKDLARAAQVAVARPFTQSG